ncbi:TonB-dependent receptor [Sphingomonas metalli]|uniref:TonB-dependent receptor n=1 Tax=Sphingomonas metalli TaxID=1779358 RepID=A0A916SXW4_9SPHN|nr:TonB-dependent receptor [Sphingomonas metalli]GGB19147.1 TonB-dependent receptor [Sphingomonas metalli]
MALIGPAAAAPARGTAITLPTTALDVALTALARQAGIDIVSTEPGLRSLRSTPVHRARSPREALDRLLAGTGLRAVAVTGGYRIERVPRPPRAPQPPRTPSDTEPNPDIVVTASKQRVRLLRYPGSLTLVAMPAPLPPAGAGTITDTARHLPVLQSTHLGAGRDKIFIRGIADSSFIGSTQATASVYLDDVQLNYSGPDAGLRLYDMQSVEVLEGAQGTLYGAGAIGGVIRLTSNPIDLSRPAAALAAGGTATKSGAAGYDLSAMANMPVLPDRFALRMVAYRVREGGYIDERQRGRADINHVDTIGGRAGLRLDPGGGWRIEASGAAQRIAAADGQYADARVGPLARRTAIDQPFSSRLLLGRMVVTHDWDSGLQLVSATGIVDDRSSERFDATPDPAPRSGPAVYTAWRDKLLRSTEMRLTRSFGERGSWVGGVALISDRDILSRTLGAPRREADIVGVTNVTNAASAFGEATFGLATRLSATLGGRLSTARTEGEPSNRPGRYIKGRLTRRIDPTAALSWQLRDDAALFLRYQTGYRTGGVAVARGVGRVADFRPDAIAMGEVGIRKLRTGDTGLAASGSISLAHWADIQADLVNRRGQPFTLNVGDARVRAVEAALDWVPVRGLHATAAALLTDNRVRGALAAQARPENRRLPETPPFAADLGVGYQWTCAGTPYLGVTGSYVGRSVLGTGDMLDVSQGDYATLGLQSGVHWRGADLSLTIDNLGDAAGNRFAFGNPFALASRSQTTPLRPINVRFGIGRHW